MAKNFNVTMERMDSKIGRLVGLAAFFLPLGIILVILTSMNPFGFSNSFYGPLGVALVWTTIYFVWGFRLNRKQEYLVVERLGKFYRVAFDGPRVLCLPHVIDNVVIKPGLGTLEFQKVDISSQEGQEIDFTDGSAPIRGSAWFTVGNPEVESHADQIDDIIQFAYVYQNSLERIAEVLIEFAREHLQGLSIDEAQKEAKKLPTVLLSPEGGLTVESIQLVGAHLDKKRPLVISDIDLPDSIRAARQKSLDAARDADVYEKLAGGYAAAVKNIMDMAQKAGKPMSFQDAYEIFLQQRALDTVGKAQSISFIAPNMDGVMKTVVVGNTKTGGGAP